MRAADAVKDLHDSTRKLAEQLDEIIATEHKTRGANVDYVLQSLLPLLKLVIGEFCSTRPENPGAALGLWLLERCGAPLRALEGINVWLAGGGAGDPCSPQASMTGGVSVDKPQVRQPSEGRARAAGPKTKQALRTTSSVSLEVDESPRESRKASRKSEGSRSLSGATFSEKVTVEETAESLDRKAQDGASDSEPESEQGNEPPRKTMTVGSETSRKSERRISFWEDRAPEEEEDEEGEEDARLDEEANAALRLLSRLHGPGQHNLADRLRRFTVNLKCVDVATPPEAEIIQLLKGVPTFSEFSNEDIKKIVPLARCQQYQMDESIAAFGAQSDCIHVVVEGAGSVSVPHRVGMVKRGDCFGEESLRLAGAVSTTSISAMGGAVTTLCVAASEFHALGIRTKLERRDGRSARGNSKRTTAMPEVQSSGICKDSRQKIVEGYVKTPGDRELIINAVKNNRVLSEVLQLSADQHEIIVDSVHLISIDKSDALMKRGDSGTTLYIVHEGLMSGTEHGEWRVDEREDFFFRVGDSFG
jgi:CRP-like cAMP-binding protein